MNVDKDTGIQYQLPKEIFNEKKRPPGHVCDPLIRQAASTATKVLEELNVPHQIRYVDQRDHPQANTPDAFYGVQIDVEGPEDCSESARYGWTNRLGSRWESAQTSRTHYTRYFPITYTAMAQVIRAWREKGLITHFHEDWGDPSEHDSEAPAKEHGGVKTRQRIARGLERSGDPLAPLYIKLLNTVSAPA